jgi:hypothetical protein
MSSTSNTAIGFVKLLALTLLLPFAISVQANEEASAAASLARENVFALAGVGRAGTMSSGEKNLRAVLKETDAVQQLQSLLKNASPAGQLYALLGLRLRDHPAFKQAVVALRKRSDSVSTIHGCIMTEEQMHGIVRQIDHGDHDTALTRDPR